MTKWKLSEEERKELKKNRLSDFRNEQAAQKRRGNKMILTKSRDHGSAFAITENQFSTRIESNPQFPTYR